MITCPTCLKTSNGQPGDACPCCYQVLPVTGYTRPDWASADADDLKMYYHRVNGFVVTTRVGFIAGYR